MEDLDFEKQIVHLSSLIEKVEVMVDTLIIRVNVNEKRLQKIHDKFLVLETKEMHKSKTWMAIGQHWWKVGFLIAALIELGVYLRNLPPPQ